MLRSLFRLVFGIGSGGPFAWQFYPVKVPLPLYIQSTQSDCIKSCSKKETGRLELFYRNMNDHMMHCKGWEAAGTAWKWQWNLKWILQTMELK